MVDITEISGVFSSKKFRPARGAHRFLKGCRLCVIVVNTMTKVFAKPTEKLSWEFLRERSSVLGVPAWKLAEDFAVHTNSDEVEVKDKPQV